MVHVIVRITNIQCNHYSLEILNVSSNQLVDLPSANHHDNQNNLVELLAGMNQLKSDVAEVVSQ